MQFSTKTVIAVAAVISSASAQTWSECNVMKGETCKPNPALGTTFVHDYTKDQAAADLFTATGSKDKITYGPEGMTMMVSEELDAPTLTSKKYIFWGKIDVVMKASPGQGVISSIVLQSDTLDEIDWEWVGSKPEEIQTNYFGKGDTTTYDRGGHHPDPGATTTFKKYTVDWTKERIQWLIDDQVIRELKFGEAKDGARYPQTPCQFKIGNWDAGHPNQTEGTLEWAGGYTDYTKKHPMVVQSISVIDYSEGAKSYTYGDKSGNWDSIKVDTTGKGLENKGTDSKNSTSTETETETSEPTGSSKSTSSVADAEATEDSPASGTDSQESTTTASDAPTPDASDSGVASLKALGSMAISFVAAAVVFSL